MPKLLKSTFKAWIDRMPGPDKPKLIVTGELEVPTSGWKATLVVKVPQGINPEILLLDVQAQAPHGNVLQVIEHIPLRYEQSAAPGQYTDVTVFYGDDSVTVNVGDAQ